MTRSAEGTERTELHLVGGQIADVRTHVVRPGTITIAGSKIVGIGPDGAGSRPGRQSLDVRGRIIVPGYIEPHTHILLANPIEFARAVLPGGTTTAVVDALPLMMCARPERLAPTLERLGALPLSLRWLIRLHPQSFSAEEGFTLERLRPLWRLPSAAAVGEVTRWFDVSEGAPDLLEKIRAARADGRRVEGHAAGASYQRLMALVAAGFTSCHEAVTADEARDRLRAGLYVMLRHSPIRPDLPQLAAMVTPDLLSSPRVMLTADGPTPVFIAKDGYMEHVLDVAIRSGIPPLAALQMVTLNPAAYFGWEDRGEIAVGKRADLNVLRELTDPRPELVIAGGQVVAREGKLVEQLPAFSWAGVFEPARFPRLTPRSFAADSTSATVCRLINDVITEPTASGPLPPDAVQAVLIDRAGQWVSRLFLTGFVDRLGGLATTTTSAFDLLVVGQRPEDMALAAERVAALGGGLAVVEDAREVLSLPLDLGGVFSSAPWDEVVQRNRTFNAFLHGRGFRFYDPVFTLLFLTFDSLPWIRLTSRGVWDVRHRRVITPALPL